MDIQVKTEIIQESDKQDSERQSTQDADRDSTQDADGQSIDSKSRLVLTPNRITFTTGNKYNKIPKDYNSRYTTKYSHGQYLWTEQRIFELIRLYKEYKEENPVYVRNQKPMWEAIASRMRELGHTKCTDDHCHTKYRTLIRQYRVISKRGSTPGIRHLEFPYYDAVSEVYSYTASTNADADDLDSEEESLADNKLASLLLVINKDKKEQDKQKFEKLESMHREKMDMFSSFLKTVSKKRSEAPSSTRTSKRLSSSARKRSAAQHDNDCNMDSSDSSLDSELLESEKRYQRKQMKNDDSNVSSLIRKMNEERKVRDDRKMRRLERMHDEKMKMFSSFLDVIKKIKK